MYSCTDGTLECVYTTPLKEEMVGVRVRDSAPQSKSSNVNGLVLLPVGAQKKVFWFSFSFYSFWVVIRRRGWGKLERGQGAGEEAVGSPLLQ